MKYIVSIAQLVHYVMVLSLINTLG